MSGASHRRSRSSAVPALNWLSHTPEGAHLLQTVHELLAAQAALSGALPPAVARQVRVARIDGQRMTVLVPGPAHAARLRQLTTQAARHLQQQGWPIDSIVVRIDAAMGRTWTQKPHKEAEPLGTQALQSFAELQHQVSPGPLADAIGRLLRHHRQ
ncbi:DciA family protein [Castellaniella caeni]|uniref:DciA family protein n=1 Tax=Castellaniella caeni TaxID=266123 RepID=UPI000830BCF0|nr:DciA family protein [Castellaniella caeni]